MRVTFMCPSPDEPIGGITALYEFANGLARRGHQVQLCHLEMWGRRVDSLADLDRYRFEPSLTHYFTGDDPAAIPDTDIVFGTGAPERLGLPVMLVQGIDMLHEHLERMAFRTPCLKVCVASWLVDVGLRYGVDPDQMRVVPMGIDHDRFRITVPVEERPAQVAILHSSHLAKGWVVGVEALAIVHAARPDVSFVAFGTAEPPDRPPWIEFHLNPDPEVLVEQIYNRSQVFVQSSDYEGFGFTAVEAMACGAALVTTDNGGSDDYARPGETALVAPPRDAEGLAAHVLALLDDAELRHRLARAGSDLVRRFDWDLGAERLEAVLADYLSDPEPYLQPPAPEAEPEAP